MSSRDGVIRTDSSSNRKHPLLQARSPAQRQGSQIGEVCGATTAECAAICCCCPCGLANFFLLVVYKVPVGLWRLALRKKRRRKLKKKGLLQQRRRQCVCDGTELQIHQVVCVDKLPIDLGSSEEEEETMDELLELENEMLARFYGAGFWRSASQRETVFVGGKQSEPIDHH